MALAIPLFVEADPIAEPGDVDSTEPTAPTAWPDGRPVRPSPPVATVRVLRLARSTRVRPVEADRDLEVRMARALPSVHDERHGRVAERARRVRHRKARFLAEPMNDHLIGVPVRNREHVERIARRSAFGMVALSDGLGIRSRRLDAAAAALAADTGVRQDEIREGYLDAADRRLDRILGYQ
jgi:hypothetical protein